MIGTTTVEMNPQGRVTVPAAVRKELQLEAGSRLEVEVKDGCLVLRPVVIIPREDAWLYTPENIARIERGLEDVRQGRYRTMSEEDLDRLSGDAE